MLHMLLRHHILQRYPVSSTLSLAGLQTRIMKETQTGALQDRIQIVKLV